MRMAKTHMGMSYPLNVINLHDSDSQIFLLIDTEWRFLEIAEGGFPVVAGSGLLRVVDLSSALAGSETFAGSKKSEIFAGSKKLIFHLFGSKFKAKLYIKLIFGGKN